MSGFKVGDVCVIVCSASEHYGRTVVVASIWDGKCRSYANGDTVYMFEGMPDFAIEERYLRRPPTRDDAEPRTEPRTDFTPAPPEFVDDLRRMMKREVVS